jgi:2-oxoisovalerate dehydrogenase E1 component alpha subunit
MSIPDRDQTVQLLSADGTLVDSDAASEYRALVDDLDERTLTAMYRHMVVVRRFDLEATNLQRQGQLALWVPSLGQEGAQVGAAFAARPQDHLFPAYREHVVAHVRGVDLLDVLRTYRGMTHGGWDPAAHGNFHLYTLVIGAHTLHATGYAMGMTLDGRSGTGDVETDAAVMAFFGDGATSQGDVNEAMVFAASYRAPVVFFLQNNHWAISVPVTTQSRTPLVERPRGFGIPSVRVDGNDPLASYAVTRVRLDAARRGGGPQFVEAVTYRMGAHTSSDDPTKYRSAEEVADWGRRDPIARFEAFLRGRGAADELFAEVADEAEAHASDIRKRTLALSEPDLAQIFDHVYSEPHPLMDEQRAWMQRYEASMGAAS